MRSFIPLRCIQDDILVVLIWEEVASRSCTFSPWNIFTAARHLFPVDPTAGVILNAVKDLMNCMSVSYVWYQ
jgi:hypothetical protein